MFDENNLLGDLVAGQFLFERRDERSFEGGGITVEALNANGDDRLAEIAMRNS